MEFLTFNYILTTFLVVISQLVFNYLRTVEIKLMIKNKIKETMVVAFFISITLLFSTYISFKSLLEGDYIIAVFYILSGLYGKYLGLKEYKMNAVYKLFNNCKDEDIDEDI